MGYNEVQQRAQADIEDKGLLHCNHIFVAVGSGITHSPEILLGLEEGRIDFYSHLILEGLEVHPIPLPSGRGLLPPVC